MAPPPLVVLYNEFFPGCGDPIKVDCSGACEFTSDQTRLDQATAVLFHIPILRGNLAPTEIPRSKLSDADQEYLTWKYAGLSLSFEGLVEAARGNPLCRLWDYLRRTRQLDPR
jgi:hypothetical protein